MIIILIALSIVFVAYFLKCIDLNYTARKYVLLKEIEKCERLNDFFSDFSDEQIKDLNNYFESLSENELKNLYADFKKQMALKN